MMMTPYRGHTVTTAWQGRFMPRFISSAHCDGYKACARLMIGIFGDLAEAVPDKTEFSVRSGSARIDITVSPWRDSFVVVVSAVVVSAARLDYDLLEFLLTENTSLDFGGFGIDRRGNVQFRRAVLGVSLSEAELRETVRYVMLIADQYDDRIQARWGGRRAIDSQSKAAPPHRRSLRVKMDSGAELVDETFQMDPDE